MIRAITFGFWFCLKCPPHLEIIVPSYIGHAGQDFEKWSAPWLLQGRFQDFAVFGFGAAAIGIGPAFQS